MVSENYRSALKALRLKFNLTQQQVAEVAGIEQTKYSGFETGKLKLDLDSAQKLSKKIWGADYTNFVSFSKTEIDITKLPYATQKAIKASENTTLNDSTNLLANELDRLIAEGHLNTPNTTKLLHTKMDKKLANRKSTEITSLLTRPPRNKEIIALDVSKSPKVFVHKNYTSKYEKMTREEVLELVNADKSKAEGDKRGGK